LPEVLQAAQRIHGIGEVVSVLLTTGCFPVCPQEVIDSAQVMCCTLSGALHPQLNGQVFDVVVIDEAAQALEPACWSAMLKGRRVVLAGTPVGTGPPV
jgi:hypothetical protein